MEGDDGFTPNLVTEAALRELEADGGELLTDDQIKYMREIAEEERARWRKLGKQPAALGE